MNRRPFEQHRDEPQCPPGRQLDAQRRGEGQRRDRKTAGRRDRPSTSGDDVFDGAWRQRHRGLAGDQVKTVVALLDTDSLPVRKTGEHSARPAIPGRSLPTEACRGSASLQKLPFLTGHGELAQKRLARVGVGTCLERTPLTGQREADRTPEARLETFRQQDAIGIGAMIQHRADVPAEVVDRHLRQAGATCLRNSGGSHNDNRHVAAPAVFGDVRRVRRPEEKRRGHDQPVGVFLEALQGGRGE